MDWKKIGLMGFGLFMIALLLWWAGIEEVVRILGRTRWYYLLLAAVMEILGLLAWGMRWRVLIESLNMKAPFGKILRALLAGIFVNNVTPGARGGGEPVRMYFLAKEIERPYGRVFATVMMDRILDTVPIVIMLAFSTVYVYSLGSLSLTLILIGLDVVFAVITGIAVGILLSEKKTKGLLYWIYRLFERFMPKKAEKYRDKFVKAVEVDVPRFQSDFRFLMGHKKTFLLALIYSSASWFFTVLRTYCVFGAIEYPVKVIDVMVVQMVGIVVGMLSVIPGGTGLIEAVNSAVYVLLGINKEVAVTATLLDRLISYWIPTGVGAVVTTHFGVRLRAKKSLIEDDNEKREKP
ncbi:lysylphosphatidylglycerol synthase transmembrane domain-containing protein [Thermococcus sp.]|uniref:lysylphosphatidylglycerol synthase transmembrane domain-containing protein n=1 Tax=Thermococcus sp. TaxID=35749 RepID=UPI0026184BEA|nr:lysylphosphatidylglycerol synthase transmembrane domain-containing protein [Thermococcus sp.]